MVPRIRILGALFLVVIAALSIPVSNVYAQHVRKSPAKAFFYSFLVPGLGHHYVDTVGKGYYFIAADIVLAGLGVGHELYSDWLEEDYRAFAVSHAGINPAGKDKDYFVAISRFNSIFSYNKNMRINRDFDLVFPETPEYIWVWDTSANRDAFLSRRIDSDDIQNRTVFFYTGIFLNHITSGIHAAIKAKRHNDQVRSSNWDFRFVPSPKPVNPTHELRLTYRF